VKRHVAALLLSLLSMNLALPASGLGCARASTGEAGSTAQATEHAAHAGHTSAGVLPATKGLASAQESPAEHREPPSHCSAVMACSMVALPDLGTALMAATGPVKGNWAPPGILRSIGTAPDLPPPRA
jgi:hypothetical protein